MKDDSDDRRSMRPFFTLWIGQAISLIGSQLVQFALIWWMTQQTGSATVLATASIAGILPQVFLGPFVGVMVDRWNRRWTMLGADFVVALATLVLALLFWSGSVELWHIYVALFIRSLGGAFHWPAMTASTSLMVPADQLTRIQGLNQILNGGLNIASAPLGALLVTLLPVEGVMMIDLATAAVAMLAVLLTQIPQPAPRVAADPGQSTLAAFTSDLRAGLRYLLDWRGLLLLSIVAMLLNLVLAPTTSFMPLLVTEIFKGTAWHLGALEAGFAIGILVGGLLLSVWGGFRRRIYTSVLGVAGIGLGILLVGVAPVSAFSLVVVGMLLSGVMSSLANGPIMAIFQAHIEPGMQGRVLTLLNSMSMGMMPIGLALAGPLADVVGVRAWFVVGGLFTLLLAVACLFIPSVMNIEEHGARVSEEPVAVPAAGTPAAAATDSYPAQL